MSTFTDGAPPSVAPEPEESRPEPDEGSLWLSEEIARRIAATNSSSGGRHARRDNGGPIPSSGRAPRHSATPPRPGVGPGLPPRPARRDQILGDAQRPDHGGQDLRPDPWTGPRRADPDAVTGSGRPSPGAGRPLPRRPSPGLQQPGAPSRAGVGLPFRPAPPHGPAAARLLSPPDEPPQAALPPGGPQPVAAAQPDPTSPGAPPPAPASTTAAAAAAAPPAPPLPAAPPGPGAPAVGPSPDPWSASVAAPAPSGSRPAPGAPSVGAAPAGRRPVAGPPSPVARTPAAPLPPAPPPPGSPARPLLTPPPGFRPGTAEATTHDALPSVIRRPDPGPPTGPELDDPARDQFARDEFARDGFARDEFGDDDVEDDELGDDQPVDGEAEDEILWSAAALPPPREPVAVPQQRAAEPEEDSEPPRGVRFPRLEDADAEPPAKRVRVVLAERKGVARPVRTVVDIQEGTAVGELLRTDLIVSQLRVALRFAVFAGLTLGALPLLFAWFPQIGEIDVLGLRLPWLLLGVLVYPFLLLLGWWHTRTAERVEQNFADHVQE